MPDNNQSELENIIAEAMKNAQPKLEQEWNNFVDKGLSKFDSRAQDIIQKVSGGNPFIESIANTGLKYSKQQLAWFFAQQMSKYNKTL